jgi:hypothetical protein
MKGMKERHGRSWSPEEEQKLKVAFLAGMPMESLANLLQRSNQAIRSRLNRLGLIESQMEPDSSIPAALPSVREESAPQAEIEAKYGSAIPPEYIDRLISALLADWLFATPTSGSAKRIAARSRGRSIDPA